MNYPWYVEIPSDNEGIEQGDFVPDCEIVIPPENISEGSEVNVDIKTINTVVLSQSCDLQNENIENVLVCPYYTINQFFDLVPESQVKTPKARRKIVEKLKKGDFNAYHLLNKQEDIVDDYLVVDFRNVYAVHIEVLKRKIKVEKQRKRLLPPYREHLSQAFARYFMRVGLPQDIHVEID